MSNLTRFIFTATLSAALCLALFTYAYAVGLGGIWRGEVTQSNNNDSYAVEMELHGSTGSINYPSLHCGGTLTYIRVRNSVYSYREHITFGSNYCTDGGVITMDLVNSGDPTKWYWLWQGGGTSVHGILDETSVLKK